MKRLHGTMTADEFRDARERLGLSLTDMACELGVGLRTIARWQSGAYPVPRVVERLVTLLLAQREGACS